MKFNEIVNYFTLSEVNTLLRDKVDILGKNLENF